MVANNTQRHPTKRDPDLFMLADSFDEFNTIKRDPRKDTIIFMISIYGRFSFNVNFDISRTINGVKF